MTYTDDVLDQLAPAFHWQADWSDVLGRAGEHDPGRFVPKGLRPRRRRFVVALVVLGAVLIPLAAVAATNDWWFFKFGDAPRPVHGPVVVREGEWSGHAWQLVAYPSATDGLCFSVATQSGVGSAMNCAPFAGVSRTAETKVSPDMRITYLSGSGPLLPTYVVGPVIDEAVVVEIRFVSGADLRVPTFDAPAPLEHVRFYATQIPDSEVQHGLRGAQAFAWIAGRDRDGKIVACLAPMTATNGISPLSACR